MLALLQEAGHEAAGGPFTINPGLIIWTLVVFGILLAVLWRLGYPALLKMVEDRERRIQKQLDDAEKANAEAQRLLEEKAILALRREAVDLSIAAASRVIEANLDTEANRKLVTEFLESLSKAEKQR